VRSDVIILIELIALYSISFSLIVFYMSGHADVQGSFADVQGPVADI